MRLHRLKLQNVYSFQDAQLTCDHAITAIVGPNDAGKTNIFRTLDYFAGREPTLACPPEMQCQFSEGAPRIEFEFIVSGNDTSSLTEILKTRELPEPPFTLTVCLSDRLISVRVRELGWQFKDGEGAEVLGKLIQTTFVRTQIRALETQASISALLNEPSSAEARLFGLAGLDGQDYKNIAALRADGLQALLNAGERATRLLRDEWKQDQAVRLEFAPIGGAGAERKIQIQIGDALTTLVPLDRKGEGLRWFLSLFVELQQSWRRKALCNLFLIDEPGVYLHPAAQADLRSLFTKLLSEAPQKQILYTTHSPFLLDWARPHQVRVVDRDEGGTSIVVDKPYHSEHRKFNFWEPFRRSIGLFLGDLGLLGEKNLFVEGVIDQILLSHLSAQAARNGLEDWRIIPFGTWHGLLFMLHTCKETDRQAAVLVDGDKAGNDCFRKFMKEQFEDVPIHSLSEFYWFSNANVAVGIEDFISREQYLLAVNDNYAHLPWFTPIADTELIDLDIKVPLGTHFEELFERKQWQDSKPKKFSKADVAIHIASSQMALTADKIDGSFDALVRRLGEPIGAIVIGQISGPKASPPSNEWCGVFSLCIRKRVGVRDFLSLQAEGAAMRCGYSRQPMRRKRPPARRMEAGWLSCKRRMEMASPTRATSKPFRYKRLAPRRALRL
jgi:AAA ATPase-like protein